MNRFNVPLASRTIFWIILIGMIVLGLFLFIVSRVGQAALLVCCGGLVLVVAVGILSENGMRRPR